MANRFCNLTGTNKIKDEFDNINEGFDEVQQELDVSDNRIDGHVAGTLEKHSTTHITNSSNISGSTTTDVLNNVKTRMDDHVAGTTEKHGSSAITNQSSQSGNTVTDAINSLAGVVQNITVTDSNANIGVYSLNASGTNTITTTFSNLTYFAGLKINLSIVNDNTGAVTVNLNSLGAKNLYKVVKNVKTALSPRDIRQGEIACIQYDGTDFILLNGERDSEYSTTTVSTSDINSLPSTAQGLMDSMVVKGRTVTNILPDAVAGCESTSGWSTYQATVALDSTNKLEGTNCLKITTSINAGGAIDYNVLSRIDTSKYYLLFGFIKNGNATNGIRLNTYMPGGTDKIGTLVSTTTYTKVGTRFQPSDFVGVSAVMIEPSISTNTSGQYGYVDGLSLIEITSTEYALGVDALLAKYSFHLGTKSADKLRVKTVGKNLLDGDKFADTVIQQATSTYASIVTEEGRKCLKLIGNGTYFGRIAYSGFAENTQYTIQYYGKNNGNVGGVLSFLYTDGTEQIIYYPNSTNFVKYTTTSSPNKTIKHIWLTYGTTGASYFDLDTLQLELGTVATSYEPYQQKQSVCPIELKAVSETIYDTWDSLSGKVTKNVEKYSLVSADIESLITTGTNRDFIRVSKSSTFPLAYGWDNTGVIKNNILTIKAENEKLEEVNPTGTNWDIINTRHTFATVADYYYIFFPKGEYADLATAKTALAGTEIYYQLTTPVTTWLQPSTLLASANGTVEQSNNFATDFYIYRNSVLIPMYVDLYMRTVDEVRKWDLRDGSYTLVPLSDVTVSGGAVSAIVGSQEGDFYSVDYYGSSYQAVNGELNFSYPINAMGQIDVTTKEVIKLESTVKNLNAQIQELLVRIVKLENP